MNHQLSKRRPKNDLNRRRLERVKRKVRRDALARRMMQKKREEVFLRENLLLQKDA